MCESYLKTSTFVCSFFTVRTIVNFYAKTLCSFCRYNFCSWWEQNVTTLKFFPKFQNFNVFNSSKSMWLGEFSNDLTCIRCKVLKGFFKVFVFKFCFNISSYSVRFSKYLHYAYFLIYFLRLSYRLLNIP